jgi:chorismate synthase
VFLREIGLEVLGRVVGIGTVEAPEENPPRTVEELVAWRVRVEASPFGAATKGAIREKIETEWRRLIDEARRAGDSLGGRIEVVAVGVPLGIGGFSQWDERLDARLAAALMSIPAIKGVEIGLGFEASRRQGSEVHDPILPGKGKRMGVPLRGSNRAGGLEGGVANGEPIVLRLAKKPIATLKRGLPSVELKTGEAAPSAFERSDVCAVPAASVIAEAMVALTLADACLSFFGGASLKGIQERVQSHRIRLAELFRTPPEEGRSPKESP